MKPKQNTHSTRNKLTSAISAFALALALTIPASTRITYSAEAPPQAIQKSALRRIESIEELRFIRERAESLGLRVYLYSDTAANFVQALRDPNTPTLANTLQSNAFINLAIDGSPKSANQLMHEITNRYLSHTEGEPRWAFRLFRNSTTSEGLRSPAYLSQPHDSVSHALVELTGSPDIQRITDLKHLNTGYSPLWEDLQSGHLRFYQPPAPAADPSLTRPPRDRGPIFSLMQYLTHAFETGIDPAPESLPAIQKIIQEFEIDTDPKSHTAKWITHKLKELFNRAKNPAHASAYLHEIGLAQKLIATFTQNQDHWADSTISLKETLKHWPKDGIPKPTPPTQSTDTQWVHGVKQESISNPNVPQAFIAPNEFRHTAFSQSLAGKKGVLISVGTFRTLHDSVMGDFSHTVLMDFHPGVTAFNHVNLELIKKAKDRREYLSLLLTGSTQAAKEFTHTKIDDQDLIKALLKKTTENWPKNWLELTKFSAETQKGIHELDARFLKEKFVTAFARYKENGTLQQTLFGSDQWFKKIKEQTHGGRYVVINGSLTGDSTMPSLGQSLRNAGLEVSAVDVSNAPEYIDEITGGPTAYFRNLSILPWSKDGVLLQTTEEKEFLSGYQTSNYDHHWKYMAIDNSWYRDTQRRANRSAGAPFFNELTRNAPRTRPDSKVRISANRHLAFTLGRNGLRLDGPCNILSLLDRL